MTWEVKHIEFRNAKVAKDDAGGIYVNKVGPHHEVFASDVAKSEKADSQSYTLVGRSPSLHPVLGPFPVPLTALKPPTDGVYSLAAAGAGEVAVGGGTAGEAVLGVSDKSPVVAEG